MDAKDLYTARKRDIAALLDWMDLEMQKHAEYVEAAGVDLSLIHI